MANGEWRMMNDEWRMMNDTNKDKERLISLAEASEIYGFNRDYLSELARRGRLEARKIGNMWVTTPTDVEAYIRSRDKRGAYRDDIEA
jgi:hypothetical protein